MKFKLISFLVFLAFSVFTNAQIVSNIKFEGNSKTKIATLHKVIRLKTTQNLDSIVVKNDAVLLSRLPSIIKADYTIRKKKDNTFTVTYHLKETKTLIPSVNFWTTVNQQFAYQIGLSEYNFLGENKQISGFYRNNGLHSWNLHYADPILFKNQLGFSATIQRLASLEPLYFKEGFAKYKYINTSIEASVFKRFTYKHQLTFTINAFKEDYRFVEGFTSANIPQSLIQNKLLYKINYDYNKLHFEYQYVNGFRSILHFQNVIPLESQQDNFLIAWNDFLFFAKIKKKGNLALRSRIGFASNKDTPFAPFALDNNLNIRGVGNIIDRGTGVIVINSEYRHTWIDQNAFALQTNIFVDAGSWRNPGGKLSDLLQLNNTRLHPGFGIRFVNKKIYNAIIRLDYGFSVLPNQKEKGFVFGIGQYF